MFSSDTKRKETRNSGFRRLKRTVALFLAMAFVSFLGLTGCKKGHNEYPVIPTSESRESSETTRKEIVPEEKTMELTIASPLSNETCQYLAKLYYAKSHGMLGDGVTGENVDLSFLDSIDLPFVLRVYSTSENGCNVSTLLQWRNSGDMPDIFLTDSFDQVVSESLATPITEYLSENKLLAADSVYPSLLRSFNVGNAQYGIPYQTSAAVLFCDMEVLRQAGIYSVSFRQTRSSLLNMLAEMEKLNEEEQTVLPFYLAGNLLPYLPSAMFNHDYLSASDTDARNEQAYRESVSFVESIIRSGYSYESLTEKHLETLFSGVSPLLSRKLGVWTGTTDELMVYDNYMPNTLSLMQIPGLREDEYTSPLLITYPLLISSACQHPKEAADFAAFIAFDEDALLLTARLQPRQGYLPSVSSPAVWKTYVRNQKYGDYLQQYYTLMDKAIMIPSVSDSENFNKDIAYIAEYIEKLNVKKTEDSKDVDTDN
ncbi:MAG: extracellular solute-binding protein [Clostridiales bacterium]|nr:extracellular solute-binding protein [Clostridiales bacterium]